MGPNDVSGIAWALGELFFVLYSSNWYIIAFIGSIYYICEVQRAGGSDGHG